MKIYISHSSKYDYQAELYEPIMRSKLAAEYEFILPRTPQNIDAGLKDMLPEIDVLVAEVSYSSTGQGIELGLASAGGVPVVCVYKEGAKPSGALRFITGDMLPYSDTDDLLVKLRALIQKVRK